MKLIKTSFFSAIITLIKTFAGFISTKFVAIYIGPSGIALVGQFINFISIIFTFGNGAINTGVVKYTAEFQDDQAMLKSLFSTSLKITFFASLLIGTLNIVFSGTLSDWLFSSAQYSMPIKALGFGLVFYAVNSLLISILNGRGQIRDYTIVNVAGSISSLVFTIILVYYFRLSGALFALAVSQSFVLFVTLFLILKSSWFKWEYFNGKFNKALTQKLSAFSLMAIVSALLVPLSQIFLRKIIIEKQGIENAGIWQGMMRVSDAYLLVVSTALGTYFLPKLSALKEDYLLRNEILKGYKVILPFVIFTCILIFVFKVTIIRLLFSSEFIGMQSLFVYQLMGDVFKIAAWLLAFLMQAKAMTKVYLTTEFAFTALYILLATLLIDVYGLKGVVIAFFLNYVFYFITMLFIFRKLMFNIK